MRKIGFLGVWDKTSLILNIAKILQTAGIKVLMIDTTKMQKARYIVPTITPTLSYITEFQAIDVAIGFRNIKEICNYLGIEEQEKMPYDVILIDIDGQEAMKEYDIYQMDKKYYVTSFDLYSLKKGLELFDNLNVPLVVTKILFSGEMTREENEYLNYLALGKRVSWEKQIIYFPVNTSDYLEISDNERKGQIRIKNLSTLYKDSLEYIANEILDNEKSREIKLAMRRLM